MSELTKLESSEELDSLLERSFEEPVLLFKHSLLCGVSFSALREVEQFMESPTGSRTHGVILEIQNQRSLSNDVAARVGIQHASPQAFVVVDGEAIWDASHWKITAERLLEALTEAKRAGRGVACT